VTGLEGAMDYDAETTPPLPALARLSAPALQRT
jgi:hypothetical protein